MNDFVAEVMQRTAGSPCKQARELLLERASDPLLAGHLEHCSDCRAFERALAVIETTLPAMAAIDPGPDFTRAVLDQTSRMPAPLPLVARIDQAFARLFDRLRPLTARPRFGLELGYVGAMVIWILFGLPDLDSERQQAGWQKLAQLSTAWTQDGEAINQTMRKLSELPEVAAPIEGRTSETRQAIAASSQQLGSAARDLDVVAGSKAVGELATQIFRLPGQLFTDEEQEPTTMTDPTERPAPDSAKPSQTSPSASPYNREAC